MEKLIQEDHKLKANLGDLVSPSLNNKSDRVGGEDKDERDGGRLMDGEGGKKGN